MNRSFCMSWISKRFHVSGPGPFCPSSSVTTNKVRPFGHCHRLFCESCPPHAIEALRRLEVLNRQRSRESRIDRSGHESVRRDVEHNPRATGRFRRVGR